MMKLQINNGILQFLCIKKCCAGSLRRSEFVWKTKKNYTKLVRTPLLQPPIQQQQQNLQPLLFLHCSTISILPKVHHLQHVASDCLPLHISSPNSMDEIEVKLRLPRSSDHQRVADLLSPFLRIIHVHHNFFFDGVQGELSPRAVLRIRFFDGDSRCMVALKVDSVLADGISRVMEDEEQLDPVIGRRCVSDPTTIDSVDSRVLRRAKEEFGVGDGGFVCLGGFKNLRNVFDWNGLVLELDATEYSFGTCFEIECESSNPEGAKKSIEEFLWKNNIGFCNSQLSKFGVFRSGRMPLL